MGHIEDVLGVIRAKKGEIGTDGKLRVMGNSTSRVDIEHWGVLLLGKAR